MTEPAPGDDSSTRELAAVAFALLGAWLLVQSSLAASGLLHFGKVPIKPLGDFVPVASHFVAGVGLLLGAGGLARLTVRGRPGTPGLVDVVPLFAVGIASLGVLLVISRLDDALRVLLPLVEAGIGADPIAVQVLLANAGIGAGGVLLFVNAGTIARWWGRWALRRRAANKR